MRRFRLGFALIGVMLIILNSCKKDDPVPSVEEQVFQRLEGTWHAIHVEVDGSSINDQYVNSYLTFFQEDAVYKVATGNGGYAFPTEVDEWKFVRGSGGMKMVRSSDKIEFLVQFDVDLLILEFTLPPASGRTKGIEGDFIFTLLRN